MSEQITITREHSRREYQSEHGRSTVAILCPFCGAQVIAYKWSMAGSGKRCECGALHTWLSGSKMKVKAIEGVQDEQ